MPRSYRRLLAAFLLLALAAPASAQLVHDAVDVAVTLRGPAVQTAGKNAAVVFASEPVGAAFTGVALQGHVEGPAPTGAVRFVDGPGWTAWMPLYVVPSANGGSFLAAYRGETVREGAAFELRFDVPEGTAVDLVEVGVFDARRDADAAAKTAPAPPPPLFGAEPSVTPPVLIDRGTWGAAAFRGTPSPLAPSGVRRMTLHHAAGFTATTRADGIAQVKAIQDFHQNGRGWSDIGYQFVVDRSGRVYQGRPFLDGSTSLEPVPTLALGAHVGGYNTGNIGVCVLGCYHPPEGSYCEEVLPAAAVDSLVALFAFLSDAYDVEPAALGGHRDLGSTACPGDNNYALLPELRQRVDEALRFGTERPTAYTFQAPFPNPVRGEATLRYYLTDEGRVSLVVYDALGREVADVVDAFQDGGRWHAAAFDASGLAGGTYFARLRVEGFSGIVFDDTQLLVSAP